MAHLSRARVLVALAVVVGLVGLAGAGLALTRSQSAAGTAVSVLPLGDSITFGTTSEAMPTPGGYRYPLVAELLARGVEPTYVGTSGENPPSVADPAAYLHDGWPGARIDEIDRALDGASPLDGGHWLDGSEGREALAPDVVVVHLGTNDIGQAHDPAGAYPGGYTPSDPGERALFVDRLVDRLESLLATVRRIRPEAAFVVCTLVPMADPTAAAYSEAIRRVVLPGLRATGARAVLADVERAFDGLAFGVSEDGIHPTSVGYDAMAAAIAPALADLVGDGTVGETAGAAE